MRPLFCSGQFKRHTKPVSSARMHAVQATTLTSLYIVAWVPISVAKKHLSSNRWKESPANLDSSLHFRPPLVSSDVRARLRMSKLLPLRPQSAEEEAAGSRLLVVNAIQEQSCSAS